MINSGTLSIDVAYKYFCMVFKPDDENIYKSYVFSYLNPKNSMIKSLQELKFNLDEIFKILDPKSIKRVILEDQLDNSNNILIQSAVMMYLNTLNIDYETFTQNPKNKYLQFSDREDLKQTGAAYVQEQYINKDLVQICYNNKFGQGDSVVKSRWYSEKTLQLTQKYQLPKIYDIADCILMINYEDKPLRTYYKLNEKKNVPIQNDFITELWTNQYCKTQFRSQLTKQEILAKLQGKTQNEVTVTVFKQILQISDILDE